MQNEMIEKAVFGGGCFWCTEAVFKSLKGVSSVLPGYAGGNVDNPTYEAVSSGTTGHAEAVQIEFDPAQVSYETLLTVFFASHDPTTLNRQGADVGTQYRSVVFYTTPEQKTAAETFIANLNASNESGNPIVTAVDPLNTFYEAEDYHRDYFANHPNQPYCLVVINPKLEKVKHKFAELLKEKTN
jgi:peptide-methionine (S)-S-oxide reductase